MSSTEFVVFDDRYIRKSEICFISFCEFLAAGKKQGLRLFIYINSGEKYSSDFIFEDEEKRNKAVLRLKYYLGLQDVSPVCFD